MSSHYIFTPIDSHAGRVVEVAIGSADAGASQPFEPTQDLVDPRIWTTPAVYVPATIRVYWNGQRLRTSLLVVSTAGGMTTITLDPSVPIELGDGSFLEAEGVLA